jgi:isoleucyl-tRNA synthetase
MTKRMEEYDITGAARQLEDFVINDVSLWYIRRSRQRFQNPATKKELQEASATLGLVLLETSKLAAPFIPFMAEHIYGKLQSEKKSVHWEDWPKASAAKINAKLEKEMVQVRELVAKGLAERAKAGIKVRQPLQVFSVKGVSKLRKELLGLMRDELNVKEVVFVKNLKAEVELDTKLTPELEQEGLVRELVRTIQGMRKKAGYQPKDKATLFYEGDSDLLRKNEKMLKTIANLKAIKEGKPTKFDVQESFSIKGVDRYLFLKKT